MSARREVGAKRGVGAGAVAKVRTRGKIGRGAERPVGAGAGVAAEVRKARGGVNVTASLAARRKREKTKNGLDPGLDPGPDLSPRKKSI